MSVGFFSRSRGLHLPERLPNLSRGWLTAYTIIWSVMLPLSVLAALSNNYINMTTPLIWSPYGFGTSENRVGVHVDFVSSSAARAAGVKPDDYVVAVDGWRVPAVAGRSAARERVVKPQGSSTEFTLKRPTGELYRARLIRSDAVDEERFSAAGMPRSVAVILGKGSVIPSTVLFITAAVLLFLRRPRETVPALLSLAFLMSAGSSNNWGQIGLSFATLVDVNVVGFGILLAALLAFPSGRLESRSSAIALLLLPIFTIPFFAGQMQAGLVLAGAFLVLALFVLIVRYRKLESGAERQQLRWAFFGLALFVIFQIAETMLDVTAAARQSQDFRWSVWDWVGGQTLETLSICAMTLGIIVSVLRYRLYDADTVIGRSAAYGILTLGFVVLFAGSQKVIELIGQEYLGQNIGGLAGGIGAALAAVAIAPMHNRAQRWAERNFQKGLYRLRHGLPALVGDLRETSGIEQIAGATLDSVMEGVRPSRSALIAGQEVVDAREVPASNVEQWLRDWTPANRDGIDLDPSDMIFPVRVPLEAEGHGRVGWLLLGPRPDGTLFGKAELEVIEEIAEPVARAAEVALRRSEHEERHRREFEALQRRVKAIEKMLAQFGTGLRSSKA